MPTDSSSPTEVTPVASPGATAQSWVKSFAFTVVGLVVLSLPGVFCQRVYSQDQELSPELNYYVLERNQRLASERQEQFRKRVAIPDAVSDEVYSAYATSQAGAKSSLSTSSTAKITQRTLLIAGLILLAALVAVRKLAPEIFVAVNKRFNPWAQAPDALAKLTAKVRAEDEAFAEFLAAFRRGPSVSGMSSADGSESDLLKTFFSNAPKMLRDLHDLSLQISEARSPNTRQRLLADLRRELCSLKREAGLPELLPAWQMASALEGLVRQLAGKASSATHSTLRTVAAGLDLLEALCVPDMPKELLNEPPFRLLAVDDDSISRNAVSLALKKALGAPDLAENGETALALVTDQTYDVIFLDVQMPGLDGFELCKKIHETVTNANTPVVFVTCHSDFEARAKSTLCGGSDLIAKPFLTFEITVKALTLALSRRLQSRAHATGSAYRSVESSSRTTVSTKRSKPEVAQNPIRLLPDDHTEPTAHPLARSPLTAAQSLPLSTDALPAHDGAAAELSPRELLQAFLNRAATSLGALRELIQSSFKTTDEGLRQEMLADFFLRFNALSPKGLSAETHPALQLASALEGLLTKLLGNPQTCNSSTLLTVATAVDLLIELCGPGVKSSLAANPPIRLLVVDDDPVARRAITGALQISFEKPEAADGGEAALELAAKKPFDAIFLDVEMPGMDGFTTCMKIRDTEQNRATPVVFVTAHADFKSRIQSSISGGNDLLGKPFLPAEIKVKALTFALQGRLQKSRNADYVAMLPAEAASNPPALAAAIS